MFSLTGKKALINGAGFGIGTSIAETFAQADAQVADHHEAGAQKIAAAGRTAQALRLDITTESEIAAAQAAIGAPLDILVSNAGVGCIRTVLQTSLADRNWLRAVNVNGTFLVTKAFFPAMIDRKRGRTFRFCRRPRPSAGNGT